MEEPGTIHFPPGKETNQSRKLAWSLVPQKKTWGRRHDVLRGQIGQATQAFHLFHVVKENKSTREKSFNSLLQASFQTGHGWSCNTKWPSDQTGQVPHPAWYHKYAVLLHPIRTIGHRHLLNTVFAPFQLLSVCFK